jgi:hypothetical protein
VKRFLVPAFLAVLAAGAGAETVVYQKFGGLNVDDSPLTVEGKSPDSENVITDVGPSLTGRYGFVSFSTSTCSGGMWEFPHSNGTRYLVCATTNTLKATTGGGTFNVLISTISSAVPTAVSILGNNLYFANTTDGLKSWDATTVTVASAALKVGILVTHKGCLWASGMATAPRTIFKSAFGNGANWALATDPVVTDPAQFVIGGAVDEPLTTIYASFQDKLMWFKSHSFGGILGSDRNDFTVRTYSDRVGTAYPESVKDCDGALRWLGGSRTVWEFTGSALVKISRGIEAILAGVVQGDANARAYEITSKTDFDAGTNDLTSNAISPGDVVLSTWTATDTTAADFGAGTMTNTTTSTVSGDLYLLATSSGVMNPGFEDGSSTYVPTYWTTSSPYRGLRWAAGYSGIWALQGSSYYTSAIGTNCSVDQRTGSQTLVIETSAGGTYYHTFTVTASWAQKTIDMSAYKGKSIKITPTMQKAVELAPGGCGASSFANLAVTDRYYLSNGGNMTFYAKADNGPYSGYTWIFYDDFNVSVSTVLTGSFLSQTFNTGLTSPTWSGTGSFTPNGQTLTVKTQSSSDGSSWDAAVAWSTSSAPTSASKRYIRYQVDMATTSAGTGFPYVSNVTLSARQSTGSYVSGSFSLGSASGFGVFDAADSANGGALTYTLYTDTDTTKTIVGGVPVAGSYTAKQIVTSGAIPTVSTAAYAFFGSTFAITAGTQNPTLSSLNLAWSEGSTLKTAAAYTNQRYWLGCAINSATNNRVLVYDRNKEWQRYSGINATAMTPYNGNLYFSNTSGVFQGETGYTDNGSAIDAYYQTHTLAPASSHLVSTFNDLMMTTDRSDATLGTTYQVNGVATDYNLMNYTMNTQPGIQDIRFPFPFSQVQQGKNVSFKWAVSGTTFWRILGATFDFTPDRVSQ